MRIYTPLTFDMYEILKHSIPLPPLPPQTSHRLPPSSRIWAVEFSFFWICFCELFCFSNRFFCTTGIYLLLFFYKANRVNIAEESFPASSDKLVWIISSYMSEPHFYRKCMACEGRLTESVLLGSLSYVLDCTFFL